MKKIDEDEDEKEANLSDRVEGGRSSEIEHDDSCGGIAVVCARHGAVALVT